MELDLRKWLSNWEPLLLSQRMRVEFPLFNMVAYEHMVTLVPGKLIPFFGLFRHMCIYVMAFNL